MCRAHCDCESLIYVCSEEDECESEFSKKFFPNPTKPKQVVKIIKDRSPCKAIIFSEEDATYAVIKKALSDEKIACKEIKGTATMREKLINEFKKAKDAVLFLNAKNNGAGINLQECTDIILYHKMAETTRTQIMGRANRIGRYNELFVHQLQVQCGRV